MTHYLDYELWRRAEDRKDLALHDSLRPEEQRLFSLTLSLARLAAQRDTLTERPR